jgi:hypothetical protein
MKLTFEQIGKKTREIYPKAYPKMSEEEIGKFYVSRFGEVEDSWSGKVTSKPIPLVTNQQNQNPTNPTTLTNEQQIDLTNQQPVPSGQVQSNQLPAQPNTSNINTLASASPAIADLIKKYFPPDQWANALAVMKGESGGNAGAVGDNYPINGVYAPSYGLFQIRGLPGRPDKNQLLDPEFNVKYAADMYKNQGWGPWTAARKLGIVR